MVGIVSIDRLLLTQPQWAALGLNLGMWLWRYRMITLRQAQGGRRAGITQEASGWAATAMCALLPLWFAFWNTPSHLDVWLLFHDAAEVSRLSWPEMLADLPHRLFICRQPPILTFYWSRLPLLWLHQLLMFPFALLCVGLLFALYGRNAALLCATPVFALMLHQPCHDTILFGLLLVVLRLLQLKRRGWAAIVYGLTYAVKPLTLLTLPFLLPRLGWMGFVSLIMWGGYLSWSFSYEFGEYQAAYVLHMLLLGSKQAIATGDVGNTFTTMLEHPDRISHNILVRIAWRWKRFGARVLPALPFYFFPVYLRPLSWEGMSLLLLIMLGFGSIKYMLLVPLFFFPVLQNNIDESSKAASP